MLEGYSDVLLITLKYLLFFVVSSLPVIILTAMIVSAAYLVVTKPIMTLLNKTDREISRAYWIIFWISLLISLPSFMLAWNHIAKNSENASRADQWKFSEQRVEQFVLLDIDPPKHVYADLRHEASGLTYENVYVGKHCNNWRDNPLGEKYNLRYNVYVNAETKGTKIEFVDIYGAFCK